MTNEQQMKLAIWNTLMQRMNPSQGLSMQGYPPSPVYTPEQAASKALEVFKLLHSAKPPAKRK